MIAINTPVKIIIGVAVLFVVLVIFSIFNAPPSQDDAIQASEPSQTVQDSSCISRCNGNSACITSCNFIIQNEAARSKDIKKCNEINDKEDKAECTMVVSSIIAETIDDCGNDIQCKDRLYLIQSLIKNDKSYCDNIASQESKEVCLNA
ncbi:hypothetical protein J4425_01195 [Candidatus Woesearchaeota archaeon]|nr:hypothetical protein [Candidatus Woesearchaeota archaeon]